MCGIVGYVGEGDSVPFLSQGMKRLEHRGYDSAGLAVVYRRKLMRYREVGRVSNLFASLPANLKGRVGIAHTRWATHGKVEQVNAHPHLSPERRLAVVHNGIIDNYQFLRTQLENDGYVFESQSDSEVIPLLLESYLHQGLEIEVALQRVIERLQGTFGLVVLDLQQPECLFAARRGSPLLLGSSTEAVLVASEASVFHGYSERWLVMDDNEIAVLTKKKFSLYDSSLKPLRRSLQAAKALDFDIELGDAPHFMLKEIGQQPQVVRRMLAGRLLGDSGNTLLSCIEDLGREKFDVRRLVLIGCGSSYHAALAGAYFVQDLARLPCVAVLASELSTANPIVLPGDLYLALSQSGETADVLAAVRELQQRGARVLSLCNQVGSSLARLCGSGIYLHAGTEVAVASTKTFLAQMLALLLVAIRFGRLQHLGIGDGRRLVAALQDLPQQIDTVLQSQNDISTVAAQLQSARAMIFLGRGSGYPLALEGALKLKEVAYLPADGLAAGEIKHGPLALVGAEVPTLALLSTGPLYTKMLANIAEIRTRHGVVVTVSDQPPPQLRGLSDYQLRIPAGEALLQPLLQAVVLQLFAYYFAVQRGCDVDHPRNLAKSVTVE